MQPFEWVNAQSAAEATNSGATTVAAAMVARVGGQTTQDAVVLKAFSLSFLTNAMFGPLLMFLHRSSDNLIAKARGYAGINKSLATLAWFWVPAHTVTFSLPVDFQIGLAALWSVALGIIMGFTKRRG